MLDDLFALEALLLKPDSSSGGTELRQGFSLVPLLLLRIVIVFTFVFNSCTCYAQGNELLLQSHLTVTDRRTSAFKV